MDNRVSIEQKSVELLAKAQMNLRVWEFGPAEKESLVLLLGLV